MLQAWGGCRVHMLATSPAGPNFEDSSLLPFCGLCDVSQKFMISWTPGEPWELLGSWDVEVQLETILFSISLIFFFF